MNILLLYHSAQTYTNTVFEHVNAFSRFSAHRYFFCHHDGCGALNVDLSRFDAVVVHYCLRLPYDQISEHAAQRLIAYRGLKVLFVQDEYDNTHRTWGWIKRLGIGLVFTVVPEPHIGKIYPAEEFPGTRFVSNLTGYVPEEVTGAVPPAPPSTRSLLVGYRGRPLPIQYGQLGQEKVGVGQLVKTYCERQGLSHDIAWSEQARIYGQQWYEFMASCRSMLGSESGSNVFDWDGRLAQRIAIYRADHPAATHDEIYQAVVAPAEMPGVMNQISPRVFEAISLRTVLVLFEGGYSGVVAPWEHYIPLKKDGSNLEQVFEKLRDGQFVDAMAERAYRDVIQSGKFGYPHFVQMTDHEIESAAQACRAGASAQERIHNIAGEVVPTMLSCTPIRGAVPRPVTALVLPARAREMLFKIWGYIPLGVRPYLRPLVRGVALPAWRLLQRAARRRPG